MNIPDKRGLALLITISLIVGCTGQEAPPVDESPAPTEIPQVDGAAVVDDSYKTTIEQWRQRREQRLRSDNGWLTLAGLYWLSEGDNSFGSSKTSKLVFPAGAPGRMGVFRLEGRTVTLVPEPGVVTTHDGQRVGSMKLSSDAQEEPTVLHQGTFSFHVIERGPDDIGIRLKDSNSPALSSFTKIDSYPVDREWYIQGRYETYDPPKNISIPNAYGSVYEEVCGGYVLFEINDVEYRIDAIAEQTGDLFLIFGDATNEKTTYGGGRFLYSDPPTGAGIVVLDFNMAVNPPCAFTPFATCPLPPPQNKLSLAIEAGEKQYSGGHS